MWQNAEKRGHHLTFEGSALQSVTYSTISPKGLLNLAQCDRLYSYERLFCRVAALRIIRLRLRWLNPGHSVSLYLERILFSFPCDLECINMYKFLCTCISIVFPEYE
jgi:hypothetical protein